MKRNDINGFEFKVCGYTFELVTMNKVPSVFAIWKHNKLIKRFERT